MSRSRARGDGTGQLHTVVESTQSIRGIDSLRTELDRFKELAKWLTEAATTYRAEFKEVRFALSEYSSQCQLRVDQINTAPFSATWDPTAMIECPQIRRKLLCVALGEVMLYVPPSVSFDTISDELHRSDNISCSENIHGKFLSLIGVVLEEAKLSDEYFYTRCTKFCLDVLERRKMQHSLEKASVKASDFVLLSQFITRWTAVLGDVISQPGAGLGLARNNSRTNGLLLSTKPRL